MNWLRKSEGVASSAAPAPDRSVSGRVERVMPGIAALLEGVSADRSHAVLDLGPAADSSLQVYSRFARWVRFADILSPSPTDPWSTALDSIPEQPQRPYDLVYGWDILDRVEPDDRALVIAKLAELTASDARLHLIVNAGREGIRYPLRFALLDSDRICYQQAGGAVAVASPLLPAELERVVAPFRVSRAFTTQIGLREYVAARRER